MKKTLLICFLLAPLFLFAQEYTVKTVPNPKTASTYNYVSNPDEILDEDITDRINAILISLEAETKAEIAVVVLNSIGNEDIKDFAIRLFKEWGIGKAEFDNGLLILFVLDQRAITFEVGYGLEGVVTDALSKRIQTQTMIPYFKEGNYGWGILEGIKKVDALVREEPIPEYAEKTIPWNEIIPMAIGLYILWGLIAFLFVMSAAKNIEKEQSNKSNKDRYSSFKTTAGSINGMMTFLLPIVGFLIIIFLFNPIYLIPLFGIPLSVIPARIYTSYRKKKFRTQPIPCNECEGMMYILSEKKDNAYLTPPQDFEENLKSVNYEVFACDKCDNTMTFRYDNNHSPFTECPNCKTKALKVEKTYTLIAPTYTKSGVRRTEYKCAYCGHNMHKDKRLPKLERAVIVSGGSSSGGSSFGGSSGGSFGGGSSGGGGATSRW